MSKEDTQHTIGHILDNGEHERDAIHIAVAPVIAGSKLHAGQHVGIDGGVAISTALGIVPIGIVDPFLREPVYPDQQFWLFLYPNTITSLKHLWTHPAFPASSSVPDPKAMSEAWLRDFADEVDADYEEMMRVAATHCDPTKYGEYLNEGGKWEGQTTPKEFWDHFFNITGKRADSGYGVTGIFSCSC
ncbi:hypothetical protein [Bradyrhizobium sp. Tv2a-2]|uniref:hypothetical protein n=1 Tax=Bradyrhizobium sp. Tv2a-2 TaxID=113395 RepID=UPI00040F8A1D|nr:hypothetical protein [Bradyrhizobium sp. Tv2a-2]